MHARKLPRISEPSFDRDYGNGATASTSKVTKNYRDRRSVSPSERGTNKLLKKLMPCPPMWPKQFWSVQNGFGLTKMIST